MGVIARIAGARMHILIIVVAGQDLLRMQAESAVAAAGHVTAEHPADADVLLVCGAPGPQLSPIIDRVFAQVPFPRFRGTIASAADLPGVLSSARDALGDDRGQARDAAAAAAGAAGHENPHGDHDHMAHGHDHTVHGDDHMDHDHMAHGHDHTAHGHDHMAMGGPGGYPLAEGAADRDGLEMDVLHRRIGPVMPWWPAGLVLEVSLAGDTITAASASMLDSARNPAPALAAHLAAAVELDRAAGMLALAGWQTAASRMLRVRDLALAGEPDAAMRALARLRRRVTSGLVLRWSLAGLHDGDGTALNALLRGRLNAARDLLTGGAAVPAATTAVGDVAALVTGRDLGTARLIVAALTITDAGATAPAPEPAGHHRA